MEVKLLKVIERHQILILAWHKQISQRKAAEELDLSLSHTKLLMRKLKKAEGDIHCFLYQRHHSAWNRLPQPVRDAVVALKEQRQYYLPYSHHRADGGDRLLLPGRNLCLGGSAIPLPMKYLRKEM